MVEKENPKQAKKLQQKKERQYLKGRLPKIKDGIATFSDDKQYKVLPNGWRKIQ